MAEAVTPHSLEAEKAVLGAILVNSDLFLDVADRLSSADFFRLEHGRIFTVMRQLAMAGTQIDYLTVQEQLKQQGHLESVGGPVYLVGLQDGMPRSTNIEAYAAIVKDRADRARLIAAARKILTETESASDEARVLVERAERIIFAVSQQETRGDFVTAPELVSEGLPHIERLLETKKGVTGIPTGFQDFDDMTRGLQPGTLVLVAARPSMGKSAFALNLAYHAASHGRVVGFSSLEMSKQELFMRLVASVGRIDGHRLQSGYVQQTDYGRLSDAYSRIADTSLHVDDSAAVGILDIRGKARRLKARHGLDLLVIDYLQLMQLDKSENRNLAIADVSRALKLLAREMGIPVVALSQLSRETERRSDKRPMMSDLRDSGALEQDADVIVFIHRPEVYQETADNAGLAEIVIAKQRNGPTGTIQLRWSKESTRFDNWAYASHA